MPAKPSRHVCLDCGRTYKAAETLNRHRKNHSATINYVCDTCDASFKRKDLLDRHCNIHTGGKQPAVQNRSQRACDRCSRLKTRCDNLVPCTRCTRGGHACSYTMKSSRARTDRSSRASLDSIWSARSHGSSSHSTGMPAISPESLHLPDSAQQLDVHENGRESFWLEDPKWQWPPPHDSLPPRQQDLIPVVQAVPTSRCNIPTMTAWQQNIDPILAGGYLPTPALYHDSDGYSHSIASSSYSKASVESPLPTPNGGPQYRAIATPALLRQTFERNAARGFPLWDSDAHVDTIL